MSDSRPRIAVIGASKDRSKYGNKAVRAYEAQGWEVFPVNPSLTETEGLPCYPDLAAIPGDHLDRVALYVPPEVGIRVLDQLKDKRVEELWVNPGAESPALLARAEELGVEAIQACGIIAVGENPARL